jgi:hypothetical protein
MWICIVFAVINSLLFGWRLVNETAQRTELIITSPSDLEYVDQTITVQGTSQEIPLDQKIWVVVLVYKVGRYYPQNDPAEIEANNQWASIIYIGTPGDSSEKFDILAVTVDSNAQKEFNNYLINAKGKSDWAGLSKLPEGTVIYDRVTVMRN